ncbi:redoxin domain-containing protein [bacterium]|nr:redoxin domain-containing protein [bacterium]
MRTPVICIVLGLFSVLLCSVAAYAQPGTTTACAIPLKGITIDGKLNDWPDGMVRYPILHHGQAYGTTDIDNADLTSSADLSPVFMIGYSAEENLLYVAVLVRDDIVQTGFGPNRTDGCEIYIEGTKRYKKHSASFRQFTAETMAALQYIMCPPGGDYGAGNSLNPDLAGGDITITGTRCAYVRTGDISVYEWAIQAYDSFPARPSILVPGKTIGMDVVVADKDSEDDNAAWVSWGPYAPLKFFNGDMLGSVLLVGKAGDAGTVTGSVTNKSDHGAIPGFDFRIYQEKEWLGNVRADSTGRYTVMLPRGKYVLKPGSGHGFDPDYAMKITVKSGKTAVRDYSPKPLVLPDILKKSIAAYESLRSYRDTTLVSFDVIRPAGNIAQTVPFLFASERSNQYKIESPEQSFAGFASLVCDGNYQIRCIGRWNQMMIQDAPAELSISNLQMPDRIVGGSMIVQLLAASDNPLDDFIKNIGTVSRVSEEMLDGKSTTVVELTIPCGSYSPALIPVTITGDIPISFRVWIGNEDFLIRKASVRLDMEKLCEGLPESQRKEMKGIKVTMTDIHSDIVTNPVFPKGMFSLETFQGAEQVDSFGPRKDSQPEVVDLNGREAPEFALNDVNGDNVTLSGLKGNVVVLCFFATWSEPCVEAMPLVQSLHEKYGTKGVRVVGIDTMEREEAETVKTFLGGHGITCRVLLDSDEIVMEQYGLQKIPAFFIIDTKGIVRYTHMGKPSDEALPDRQVEELLAE